LSGEFDRGSCAVVTKAKEYSVPRRSGLRTWTKQRMSPLLPYKTSTSTQLSVSLLNSIINTFTYKAAARNRLESFIRSRSEWCISRQRVWGVPIPALYHAPTGRAVLSSESLEHILSVLDEKGVAHWWNGSVSDFVPASLRIEGEDIEQTWSKGMDTMDVWFDSGSSWSMLEPYAEGREHLADVCLEGSDQHRGWFQSQLLTAVGAAGQNEKRSPYGTLITHGMVLDQAGKKMSKSLGNIVSPMTIIEGGKDKKKQPAYGAEVLRLWASTVEYWRDMALGNVVLNQVNESLRKIRNSARFILGNIGDDASRKDFKPVTREQMGLAEKYVMHELFVLEQTALQGYTTYNFTKGRQF
jgi:isoleucyl-tRNA synthetase